MTVEKLIAELNKRFDLLTQYESNRKKEFCKFHNKIKAEEKIIRTKLDKNPDLGSSRKLKRKLKKVNKAYSMLNS